MNKDYLKLDIANVLKKSKHFIMEMLGLAMPNDIKAFLNDIDFDRDIVIDETNNSEKVYFDRNDDKIHISKSVNNIDDLKEDLVQTIMMEIIDVRFDKHIAEKTQSYIPGEFLSRGLVELYSQRMKSNINFDVQTKKQYLSALEFAQKLESTITKAQLPYFMFKMNANELLDFTNDDELIDEYKRLEQEYIDEFAPKEETSLEDVLEDSKEKLGNDSKINIIYHCDINGNAQTYLKFKMNNSDEYRIIKIYRSSEAIKKYSEFLAQRDNSNPLTAEEFIEMLKADEIILRDEQEFVESELPNLSNQKLSNLMQVQDYIQKNNPGKDVKLFANAKDNVYVTSEGETIMAEEKSDGTLSINSYGDEDTQEISISPKEDYEQKQVITFDEYKRLLYKDDRTPEEDNLIYAYEIAHSSTDAKEHVPSQTEVLEEDLAFTSKPVTRRLITNKLKDNMLSGSNAAFINPLMSTLIVAITIVLGIAIALVMYSTLG